MIRLLLKYDIPLANTMMKFSIIVPVYNVAPYLRECLHSVIAASDKLKAVNDKWATEIVCVDDGSADGSSVILDEYATKDNRFKVIHQKNQGVSVARNEGLSAAQGEWILFLDGDDVLTTSLLVDLYNIISKNPTSEIIAFNWCEFSNEKDRRIVYPEMPSEVINGDVLNQLSGRKRCLLYSVWNKCYSTNLLRKHKVYYSEGVPLSEDYSFALRAINHCHSFCITGSVNGYCYRKYNGQTTSKINLNMIVLQYKNIVDCIDNYDRDPKLGMRNSIELMVLDYFTTNGFVDDKSFEEFIVKALEVKEVKSRILTWVILNCKFKVRIMATLLLLVPKRFAAKFLLWKRLKLNAKRHR